MSDIPDPLTDRTCRTLLHPHRLRTATLWPQCRAYTRTHGYWRSHKALEDIRRISEARCRNWPDRRFRRRPREEPRCRTRAWIWTCRNIRGVSTALGDLDWQRKGRHQWRERSAGQEGWREPDWKVSVLGCCHHFTNDKSLMLTTTVALMSWLTCSPTSKAGFHLRRSLSRWYRQEPLDHCEKQCARSPQLPTSSCGSTSPPNSTSTTASSSELARSTHLGLAG